MRTIVCAYSLVIITLISCNRDQAEGSFYLLSDIATAAPAHRTDRERHIVKQDSVVRWGQWEFVFPTFWGWMDYGPICGGVIEYPYWSPRINLPALPDSMGVLTFDATEFRDTSFGGLMHCWSRDNVVMPLEKDVIKHTIWNKGTLPVRIDSVLNADHCEKVFCHRMQLLPGDSTTIWFTTECMHFGWNVYQLKMYYTNLMHYPMSGKSEVQVFETVTYYINYRQLE